MRKTTGAIIAIVPLVILGWLFLGIERVPDEGGPQHSFFIKQQPSLRIIFQNPVTCAVCDLRSYQSLSGQDRAEFSQFCKYRLGLDRSDECYTVFKEQYNEAQTLLQQRRREP